MSPWSMSCEGCGKEFDWRREYRDLYEVMQQNGQDRPAALQNFPSLCRDCLGQQIQAHNRREEERKQQEAFVGYLRYQSLLYRLLVFVSLVVLAYSVAAKFLIPSLPAFPFFPYIISYALLIFFFRFSKGAFSLFIVMVLINFGSPTFRGIFFSYFSNAWAAAAFTVMFILSNISSLTIFSNHRFFQLVEKHRPATQEQQAGLFFRTLFPSFLLYFGLISPFYLGVIRPGSVKARVNPEATRVDKVYKEELTAATHDRQSARNYYIDGKKKASLGGAGAMQEALTLQQMALNLIPNFSSAAAEAAYARGSLARIRAEAGGDRRQAQEDFTAAHRLLDQALAMNRANPDVHAVRTILFHYQDKSAQAADSLAAMKGVVEKWGHSDRVFQALALLEPKKVDRVKYLQSIAEEMGKATRDSQLLDLYENNAEITNYLALGYFQIGNPDKARKLLERALVLSPLYGEAYINTALFAKRKEQPEIFLAAGRKDPQWRSLGEHYLVLWRIQKWLGIFYLVLFVFFFFRSSYISFHGMDYSRKSLRPHANRQIRNLFFTCLALFVASYAAFELYIHVFRPVNTVGHLFPTAFPFF